MKIGCLEEYKICEVIEMTERKNELVEVLYTDKFTKDYLIQDDINLLLNSVTVFGITNLNMETCIFMCAKTVM